MPDVLCPCCKHVIPIMTYYQDRYGGRSPLDDPLKEFWEWLTETPHAPRDTHGFSWEERLDGTGMEMASWVRLSSIRERFAFLFPFVVTLAQERKTAGSWPCEIGMF